MFVLRDYQGRLATEIINHMLEGGAPCGESPTGSGKTVVLSEITKHFIEAGHKVLLLAHRDVIIKQIAESCIYHTGSPVGFYSRKRMTEERDITVAMIPTLAKRKKAIPVFKNRVVLLDEGHHISAKSYQSIIKQLEPSYFACVSATPVTPTGVGLGPYGITKLIRGPSPMTLMEEGSLCKYDLFAGELSYSTGGISLTGGDFNKKQVEERIVELDGDFTRDLKLFNPSLEPTIAITISVAHAHVLASEYRAAGISAEVVVNDTPESARESAFQRFKEKKLNVIISVALIDEGLDLPEAVCLQLVRATKSIRLWKQLIGRVLRTDKKNPGKRAIIIVHSDCWKSLPLPDLPIDWTLEGKLVLPPSRLGIGKDRKIIEEPAKPPAIVTVKANKSKLTKIDTRSIYEREIESRVKALKRNLFLVEERGFSPGILRPWADNPDGLTFEQRRRVEHALCLPPGFCDPRPMISKC